VREVGAVTAGADGQVRVETAADFSAGRRVDGPGAARLAELLGARRAVGGEDLA
jgi:hypothetical protein